MSVAFPLTAVASDHRAITVAALMATYMEAVNISLPNAALPHIQGTLSMADDEIGWVFTAYIAPGAAVMPMARWLAGRFGRKTVYQVSLAIFSLGLVLNTLATTSMQLVFARIVQGAAAGPLGPLSLAMLLDVLPPATVVGDADMMIVGTGEVTTTSADCEADPPRPVQVSV